MAKDMKYMNCRNGIYGIDCRIPKDSGLNEDGEGLRIRVTLRTDNYAIARRIRDTTIVPLMSTTSKHAALTELVRQIAAASKESRNLIAQLAAAADVDHIAGIRSAVFDTVKLSDIVGRWFEHLELSDLAPTSKMRYQASLNVWLDVLGEDTDAQTITKSDVIKGRDRLLRTPKNYYKRNPAHRTMEPEPGETLTSQRTVRNHVTCLGKFFTWAIANNHLVCENPARGIEFEASRTKNKRMPTLAEIDALCAMPKAGRTVGEFEWRHIPLLQRYTAARFQEIAGLYAEDIVTQDGILCFSFNENRRRLKTAASVRLVPVADILVPVVEEILAQVPTGRLFPHGGDQTKPPYRFAHTLSGYWNLQAKKIAPDLSTHSLRHYAHTRMIEGGANLIDVKRIVGHTDKSMSAIYTAKSLERCQSAVNKIRERELAEISRDQSADK